MKHELRDMRVAKAVEQAPESAKNLLTRAFSGAASPRQAIKAIEVDERYFDIACERIARAQTQESLFV